MKYKKRIEEKGVGFAYGLPIALQMRMQTCVVYVLVSVMAYVLYVVYCVRILYVAQCVLCIVEYVF